MYARKIGNSYYAYESVRVDGKIMSRYLGKMDSVLMSCSASEAMDLEKARAQIEHDLKAGLKKMYHVKDKDQLVRVFTVKKAALAFAKPKKMKVKTVKVRESVYRKFKRKELRRKIS